VQLASRNPARMLGMDAQTTIAVGSPANFNVYNEAGELQTIILHGRR
jgi:N-acetylglucosamine-6-phosphate deacetylase